MCLRCKEKQRPNKDVDLYMEEYDVGEKIFGDCDFKDSIDMGGYYLVMKVMNNCENVSVKTYDSKKGFIREEGLYHNDFKIDTFPLTRNLSGGLKHIDGYQCRLKRKGEWLFYDSLGTVVRRETY